MPFFAISRRMWPIARIGSRPLGHTQVQLPMLRQSPGHADAITAVKVNPNNQFYASASADKTVRLWTLANGQAVRNFDGHTAKVNA
ncbi:MAG TPA: hypothetical protein PKC08_10715, partial [Pseudomonadales bacterium]|nr:hypothetical protein [Pseudomonadales bacterium]